MVAPTGVFKVERDAGEQANGGESRMRISADAEYSPASRSRSQKRISQTKAGLMASATCIRLWHTLFAVFVAEVMSRVAYPPTVEWYFHSSCVLSLIGAAQRRGATTSSVVWGHLSCARDCWVAGGVCRQTSVFPKRRRRNPNRQKIPGDHRVSSRLGAEKQSLYR